MTHEEILAKREELRTQSMREGITGEELDAIMTQIEELRTAETELREKEKKQDEIRNEVAHGSGEIKEIIKNIKEDRKDKTMNEQRTAWLKNLMGRPLNEEERTALSANPAIPTETLNMIVTRIKQNPLLSHIDLMNIPGFVTVPVLSTDADASWTATSTDSADAITGCQLNAYQLIKTIEVPVTVDAMSIDAFEAYITEALANKIETALQTAVIAGTGSSQATGILTTVNTATGTFTRNGMVKKDLLKIMGSLPGDMQKNACWIMPASVFYSEVMNIADSTSFVNLNEGFIAKVLGKDVIVDDNCKVSGVDVVLYGDAKHYRMNLGKGIEIAKDTSVGFRSGSVVYRASCLADGKLDMASAFVRYDRSGT